MKDFRRIIVCIILLAMVVSYSTIFPSNAASTGLGEVKISGGQRDFMWPVPGVYKITSCFLDPDYASTRGRMHYAIDIGAASGKSVVASYDGVVDNVGSNSSEGNWVRLKHNYKLATGETLVLYTKYIHLKSYSVEKNQTVKKGEEIAKVGSTGTSSSHLDFQILTNTDKKSASNSLDPYANNLLELPAGVYYAGSCNCCKSYISTIKELYETPLSYLSQCIAYTTHVTIKTARSTYIKSLPCSEKTDANSENVEVASAGTQYEAIGLYQNTAGNLWYKVKAKNGSVGYMYAADAVFVSENSSDIVHSGITVPANHTQGNSYQLTGMISSTYSKINKVSVYIYDAKGNKVTGAEAAVTGNKYSFKGSAIDNKTKFGSLGAGKHTYKIVAYFEYCYADPATSMATITTWSSAVVLYEKTFNVVGSAGCSHSYSGKVTTAATCTTAGVKTYTCSNCSNSYTETIAATGHSWKNATCTTAKTCTTCGATSGTALGHSYNSGTITTAATCTTAGVKTYTCSTCGTKKTESITAAGHNWKDATCTVAKTCTACGATSGTALGHSYNSGTITTAATCTTAGVKTYTCSTCGTKKTESVAATGHSYESNTTDPTCSKQGYTTHMCTVCHDSYKDSYTPVLEHTYSNGSCTSCGAKDPDHVVDAQTPEIVLESKSIMTGEKFTIAVEINNNPGFSYLEMTPIIAPEFTLVKAENGELLSDFTIGKQYVWVADEDVTEDGVLLMFTFVAEDNVQPGNYQITFNVRTCGNYEEEVVMFSIVAANVEVTNCVHGDATGDGTVDGFDVIRLKKYLANYDYDTESSTVDATIGADANGDGKVDGFDVIRLKKYLANYDYETGESTIVLGPQ